MQYVGVLAEGLGFQTPNGDEVQSHHPTVSVWFREKGLDVRMRLYFQARERCVLGKSTVYGPLGGDSFGSGLALALRLPPPVAEGLRDQLLDSQDPVGDLLSEGMSTRRLSTWELRWMQPWCPGEPQKGRPQHRPVDIGSLDVLPALPGTYAELCEVISEQGLQTETVAEVVRRDPGLASQVLSLANASPPPTGKVASVDAACKALGVRTLRDMVLLLEVMRELPYIPGINLEQMRRQAVRVANATRSIYTSRPDDAYTAGLLHDVGRMAMAARWPTAYGEVRAKILAGSSPYDAQRSVLGVTEADVMTCLLRSWGLPPRVIEAVSLYRTPRFGRSRTLSLVDALHVGWALSLERFDPQPAAPLDYVHLHDKGLLASLPMWRAMASRVWGDRPKVESRSRAVRRRYG